jgi:hypothetical protein
MVQLLALLLSKVYNRLQERPRIASPHIFLLKFVDSLERRRGDAESWSCG